MQTPSLIHAAPVTLIGVACGAGARDQRCNIGPELLYVRHAETALVAAGIPATWHDTLRPQLPAGEAHSNAALIADVCRQTAQMVQNTMARGQRFAVIGGDHSCAIGTWSGAATALEKRGPLGLLWIDAHMDSHTPQTSRSGALHGMPLACLLGHGLDELRHIARKTPKVLPQHLCLIGVRSYEPEEQELLNRLGVRVYAMREIRERGLHAVVHEAMQQVMKNTAGFGITIDLDAIDPVDAPGVGSPEQGGLLAQELLQALQPVKHNAHLIGVEIAELNPFLDRNDKTARLTIDLLRTML